jgi:hypothetical protein
MLGLAYQTRDMKMCQEIALHPWIQSWIGGGGRWDGSIQSKGNFLYSVATTNSTKDSSTKMMEDGVVDSPPNRNVQPVAVSSPSPLRAKCATPTRNRQSFGDSRSSRKLYNNPLSSLLCRVVKVFSNAFTHV